jgi:hypothetical protein
MIRLQLSFSGDETHRDFEINGGELLQSAIDRSLDGVPKGEYTPEEMFNVTVNGLLIEPTFWEMTKLKESDTVLISPRIGSGDSGQLF